MSDISHNSPPDPPADEVFYIGEIEVKRVDGTTICETCGLAYGAHPRNPDLPMPAFVVLCDGTNAMT